MPHKPTNNPAGSLTANPIVNRQEHRQIAYIKLGLCGLCARALAIRGELAQVCYDCLPIYDEARANGLI